MNIIQYNIRGLENNRNDIDTLQNLYKPSVFCLQETHIKNNIPSFLNYKLIHNYNPQATQGLAFLLKKDLQFSQIPLITNFQAIAISINMPFKVNICNIYIHPTLSIDRGPFQNLINQIPQPRLILGDFNAHNPLWGAKNKNGRGQVLEEIISANNLICLNQDEFTYFHPSTGTATIIDLTMCNTSIASKLNWKTLEQIQSDHVPIISSTIVHNSTNTINYNHLDWKKFEETLKAIPIVQHPKINEKVTSLTARFIMALQTSMKPWKNFKKCIPWWTPKLSLLRKRKKP